MQPTTTLGLTIPTQNSPNPKIDLSVAAIEKSHLQMITIDIGETARNIINKLKEINATTMEPNNRFKILDILNESCSTTHQTLRKSYINQNQILSEKKLIIIELSRNLLSEIINGYKIIIENIYSSHGTTTKNTVLSNAIYLAFTWYNNLLFTYYEVYERIPISIPIEMNIIYNLAANYQILEEEISITTSLNDDKKHKLSSPYKYALFLIASNPYQWRQNEQELLYKSASLWEEFIIIRKCSSDDRKEVNGLFLISMNKQSSSPLLPTPLAVSLKKINFNEKELILDLSKLILHLTTLISQEKPNDSNQLILTNYSITKLISYLKEGQTRKLERFNIIGDVSAAFGFIATHYYINQKKPFKPDNLTGDSSKNNVQEFQLGADTDLETTTQTLTATNTDFSTTDDSIEQEYKSNSSLYKCSLTNIQEEGAGISFQQDALFPPIQPGEIVAMSINTTNKLDLDETHWSIGIVCWLQHDDQKKLMAGIKILAPSVTAAAVQLMKADSTPIGYFQRAFLFKNINSQENIFTLITPLLQFEPNKKVKIFSYYFNDFFETTLKEQLNITNNFKCFTVELNIKKPDNH